MITNSLAEGDLIRIPQNALLYKDDYIHRYCTEKNVYGVIVEVCRKESIFLYPEYKVLIGEEFWYTSADNVYPLRREDGQI